MSLCGLLGLGFGPSASTDYPAVGKVALGESYSFGALIGTRTDADPADVRASETYGDPGDLLTGTLVIPTPFTPNTGDARIIQVCDAVVDLLNGTVPDGAQAERLYAPSDALKDISGKQLRVFPETYLDAERLARNEVNREYAVVVDFAERYEDPASSEASGAVPKEWSDERVAWVAHNLYDLLNTWGVHRKSQRLLGTLYPQSCEVRSVFDREQLDTNKVFRSYLVVTYREPVEA